MLRENTNSRWLIRHLTPKSPRIAASVILAVLSGVASTIDPLIMRRLIDYALPGHRTGYALLLVAAIAACFLGRHVLLGCSRSLDFAVEQDVGQNLRISVLEQLNRLSADYHEQTPVGEKLKRLEGDVDQIAELGAEFGSCSARSLIFFAINLVVMTRLSTGMTYAVLPTVGLFWWAWAYYRPRMEERSQEARQATGRASSILLEFLAAQPQIQLLCSQKLVEQKSITMWAGLVRARKRQRNTEILFMVTVGSIFVLANLLVLGVGSFQVLHGSLTVGGLVAFYAFTTRIFEPVSSWLDIYSRLQRVGASIRTVRDVLEREPHVADLGTIVEPRWNIQQGISLSNVSFSYSPDRTTIRTFDLRISPLDRIGIVGPSGSGKSTLARLLARMSDPQGGQITIDGYPLPAYKLEALRRTVRYLPQCPVLFQGTVEENLRFGNPDASLEDLKRVISVTQLEPVLQRLPAGLAAILGPHGHSLSGGELQRLALARTLLREPPVLILDESTSALDLPTERLVLEAIANYCTRSILIVISHRVASITWLNRIVVLSSGQIVDVGDHDSLYANSSFYRRLYESTAVSRFQ